MPLNAMTVNCNSTTKSKEEEDYSGTLRPSVVEAARTLGHLLLLYRYDIDCDVIELWSPVSIPSYFTKVCI
jgi:hypothetical protein